MNADHLEALRVMRFLSAERHAPAMARADRGATIPDEPGLYAWWRRSSEILPAVPAAQPVSTDDAALVAGLLYVGISPSRTGGGARLRSRLRQHLEGQIGSSTVRRTLAALLWQELGLRPRWASTRPGLSKDDQATLSAWQDEHLRVSWIPHPAPWAVEHDVIARFGPPLNLAGNTRHPFHRVLAELRARLRQEALERG